MPVIKGELRESRSIRSLVPKQVAWESQQSFKVTSIVPKADGSLTISGDVDGSFAGMACPGSCGRQTFSLVIAGQTNGITPNAVFTIETTRFNESTGHRDVFQQPNDFNCTVSQ
jgi:hypothetical protein